jgi:hypothetical protein
MLQEWILEALRQLRGKGMIVDIAEAIWNAHNDEIRKDRDLLWTWQYRMRWAGTALVQQGKIRKENHSGKSVWIRLK